MEKNKKLYRIITIVAICIVTIFTILIFKPLVSFINEPDKFRKWIDSFGILSPIAYMLIVMLQILVPVIPGEPMEIMGGYAFGTIMGSVYCLVAESLSSIIIIYFVRKYGRKIVDLFFDSNKIDSLSFIKSSKNKLILFAIIFIMPGTPKDLLCYFAGLTDLDIKSLFLITSIGRIPSILTSTISGDSLGDKNYISAIIVIIITAIISAIGLLIYKKVQKEKSN